jgi:hypothetical protein
MSTVLLNGQSHGLSFDGDVDDEGRAFSICTWDAKTPPNCPNCDESLGKFCDSESRKVSVHAEWAGEYYVECDGCEALFPIDGAPPLKRRTLAQADGHEPGIVEDEKGDDRS